MPRFLQPRKSTQHRVAAIALYRALLSRCSTAPLPDEDRSSLRNAIRNKFRRNRKIQSPRQLALVFRAGYETLDRLAAPATDTSKSTFSLTALLSTLPDGLKRPPPVRPPPAPPQPPSSTKHPLPPDRAVLNVRPYARTSGPRHVPILASANGIPFLRLTKPQPPALSRVIRQKLQRRVERFHRKIMLTNYWIPIGRYEDEWDAILKKEYGFRDEDEGEGKALKGWNGRNNGGANTAPKKPPKWVDVMLEAFDENLAAYEKDIVTDKAIAKKMMEIVDAETRAAKLEGQTVVRGRKGKPILPRWPI